MSSNHSVSSSSDFISKEISSVILGDRRLVARAAKVISQNQNSHRTGFFLHARYLLGGNHVPLGVWGMDFGVRDPKDRGQAKTRENLPIEEKSSFR